MSAMSFVLKTEGETTNKTNFSFTENPNYFRIVNTTIIVLNFLPA
jgi:hypothetical protein